VREENCFINTSQWDKQREESDLSMFITYVRTSYRVHITSLCSLVTHLYITVSNCYSLSLVRATEVTVDFRKFYWTAAAIFTVEISTYFTWQWAQWLVAIHTYIYPHICPELFSYVYLLLNLWYSYSIHELQRNRCYIISSYVKKNYPRNHVANQMDWKVYMYFEKNIIQT
jgi:hypothetical protein